MLRVQGIRRFDHGATHLRVRLPLLVHALLYVSGLGLRGRAGQIAEESHPEIKLKRSMSQVNNEKWLQDIHTPQGMLRQRTRLGSFVGSPSTSPALRAAAAHVLTPLNLGGDYNDVSDMVDVQLAEEREQKERFSDLMQKVGAFVPLFFMLMCI